MESSDPNTAVRITPQSQTAHLGVWIENFTSLWLLLKGPSGEILLGVNTSIMKEKIWSIKSGFTQPKFFTPQCHAHRGVEIGEIETEFENTLPCLSGAQMGRIMEK